MEKYELFSIVPTDETNEKFTICIGDGRATKKEFNSTEEAKEYIDTMPWELVGAVSCFIATKLTEKNDN